MSHDDGGFVPYDLEADEVADDRNAAGRGEVADEADFEAGAVAPRRHGVDDDRPPGPEERRRMMRRRSETIDSEELLHRVRDIVASARSLPLSASVSINRDEVLELLDEVIGRLPDEMREARWLRKEREEYLAKMRSDGEEILEHARAHAERLVQRTEVVKSAEHRAKRVVDNASNEARRLRLEMEDFCDQKLARFEIVLERTLETVGNGRAKLQATNLRPPTEPGAAPPDQP